MCLGIPVKINKIDGLMAEAEFEGVKRHISLQLLKDVKVGDYCILHAGFAISKLDEEEAGKSLMLFKELE